MPDKVIIPGLGKKLAAARAAADLSLDRVQALTGINRNSVCRYENSARTPSLGQLYRLAAAYGVSIADLLPPPPAFATKKKRNRQRRHTDAPPEAGSA